MGFLDHSTNNIIVDAVLTDYGREQLALLGGNGAGNLVKFYAFADTEVDYSMITKYGTIVGKEKIEKNTPIFEASTSANAGIHTLLVTTENPAGIIATTEVTATQNTVGAGTTSKTTVINVQTSDPDNQLSSVVYAVVFDPAYLVPQSMPGRLKERAPRQHIIYIEANGNEAISVTFRVNDQGRTQLVKDTNSEKGSTEVKIINDRTSEERIQTINLDYTNS